MKDHSLSAGLFALNRVAVAAAFSALSVLPVSAWALGLGKLNVQSSLGEGLRAEIDVTSLTPEEGASLQVRVASPETYRAAGVDYNSVLGSTSVVLQRRADGRPYLRISSDRAVQEPFVDVILDLAWSSGRLVREYTLLFDPPSRRSAAAVTAPTMDAPVAQPAPVTSSRQAAAPKAVAPTVAAESPKTTSRKAAKPPVAASAPEEARAPARAATTPVTRAESTGGVAKTVRVRSGDSLSHIAGQHAQSGVSLDQMLVSLYRQNPEAFQGNNMNRLKSGVVLNIPTAEQARQVTPQEARQVIQAQSSDFSAYRQQLATAVSGKAAEQPQRQAKGKVEAEVKDTKQAATPSPDKLTLSKGSMAAGAGAQGAEDRLAASRAKQDSTARVAELSKNLEELRKLKEKAAAASAATVVAKASAPAVVPSAPAAKTPVAASAPVAQSAPVVASAPASSVNVAQAAASAASLAGSGAATAVADMASAPASAASAVAPRVQAPASLPAPAAPEEPGFLESLNPMLIAAGGAGVALLAGVAMFLRSRRRADSGETSFLESRLQPDSFFGASGGQRVDTRDASAAPSSMSYSLSQLDAIGDVDPVAEADVYLAYGRDLQAEEILKEALRSNPDRLAIRTKLLEVYAKRRDTKGFEQLAVQLYDLTNGAGEDWVKAQELGIGIDPENPLYQPGGHPSETSSASPVAAAVDVLGASTVPHSVMPAPSVLDTQQPLAPQAASDELMDLDLDISASSALDEVTDSVSPQVAEPADLPPLELPDVAGFPSGALPETPADVPAGLDLPSLEAMAPASPMADDGSLDFDLALDEPGALTAPATAGSSEPAPMAFDLNSISLDLAETPAQAAPVTNGDELLPDLSDVAVSDDPMARKFELAEEFRQIGDVDGARELLQEVVENSQDGALKSKAQAMLGNLG